jgi:hypothetical protein
MPEDQVKDVDFRIVPGPHVLGSLGNPGEIHKGLRALFPVRAEIMQHLDYELR